MKNPMFNQTKRFNVSVLLFTNAILGVYLHTYRLSSLLRKVLMVEVLLENFSSFFFNSFPLFTLMVLDASSIML